jgi:CheY-like chemotaxis protein
MGKKVVIVEDDFIIQELHKHYIENLGHEVAGCFTSGEEAIDFFSENTADLILMDIRLESSTDGIETMKKINEINTIPVAYITGNTEELNLKRALNTGMKGFYSKPIKPKDLEDIIDSIIDLNESILYAERIQKAIFPQKPEIHRLFHHSIYINRPKDVISGDFCLLVPKKESHLIIGGIGDCTGHGVPAALLSVLCHEIITSNSEKYEDLRKIIFQLNESVIQNLSRLNKNDSVSDGLDLVLFKINPEEKKIDLAGINRPFIHYQAKEQKHNYYKLKGKAIGEPYENDTVVPLLSFDYCDGDYFYFFSDGITDQFGGSESKKLMKSRLLEFLEGSINMPLEAREIEFELFLRKWQGNNKQTDDMIFIGICPSELNTDYNHYTA